VQTNVSAATGTGVTVTAKTDGNTQDGETNFQSGSQTNGTPLFGKLEATPVKVGEAPPLPANTPELPAQLAAQVSNALAAGTQSLTLQLSPASLGKLVVELTRGQDGTLQVVLQTANAKAAQLLSHHAPELSLLLRGDSQTAVSVQVNRQEETPQNAWEQRQDGQHQGRQQEEQAREREQGQDFLEKLRLGLTDLHGVSA
jgi:flagellar hook-length control protein FliK